MSLLCWNARGLADPRALRRFRFAVRKLSPTFVFVSETKLFGNRISSLRKSLGFLHGFGVDSRGSKGGLALFWQPDWQVDLKSFGPNHIDTFVTDPRGDQWRFTGFYGNPVRHLRLHSWELIRRLHSMYSIPWLIGGDFNEIIHLSKKLGGSNRCSSSMREFADVISHCGLRDIGFSGPPFTWKNNQVNSNAIHERLDRFLANVSWNSLFKDAKVTHHDFYGSDHRILTIEFFSSINISLQLDNRKPFRFEPFWQSESNFPNVMAEIWNDCKHRDISSTQDLMQSLEKCGKMLKSWSFKHFGNIQRRIKDLQDHISISNSHPGGHINRELLRSFESQLDQLLAINESYWKQRARADWLAGGDSNTKFFHRKATIRKSNNRIEGIQSSSNEWTTNPVEVQSIILNYFVRLFSTSNPSQSSIDNALYGLEGRISDSMKIQLDAPFTGDEIKEALFKMAPWKAPGPDGYHAGFFQKNWDILGSQITSLCLQILNGNQSIGDLNSTVVVLIPKCKRPQNIMEYRPISLCNVLAKVVAKVMANRMKFSLPQIIDNEQSAFIPGRLITDNILVAFECLHYIRNRKKRNKGLMAVKLDMNKAYDRVEWKYLCGIMNHMGFSSKWIDRVMDYLSTTRLSILINGKRSTSFRPSRGLRQGCPLSPYLFLLCSQRLSSMLKSQAALGFLRGVRCARNAPEITHLFFADDTLLFGHSDTTTCNVIRSVLENYEKVSGQVINVQKSYITFSPNATIEMKDHVFHLLNMHRNELYELYLGLPAFSGRNKQRLFEGIKEKVWKKLQGWKSQLFSAGGREVLIKAVAQAIPSYTMSIFRLPLALCDKLRVMITNFWWGASGDERKIHWRKWSLLCRQKKHGGLGFRDFSTFNQALLAKQAWRVLTDPDSLAARIFKQRYFPSTDFLQAKAGCNPSYVWRSVLWGRDLLAKGIRWRIGRGTKVNVFKDPWLLRPINFKPITIPNQNSFNMKVNELINESGNWDWCKINDIMWEVDRVEVNRVPVGCSFGEDLLIWNYSPNGLYTVRSGYHLAKELGESNSIGVKCGFSTGLTKLWNLKLPNKIKILVWKCLFNALPVRVNLIIRGVDVSGVCPCCRMDPEDVHHVFWYCHFAKKVWKMSSLWIILSGFTSGGFGDLFQWVFDHGKDGEFEMFVLICWSLWTERNQVVFQGKMLDLQDVLARAIRTKESFMISIEVPVRISSVSLSSLRWKPPSTGFIKVNVDAAVFCSSDHFSVGLVGRDSDGLVMFAEGRILPGSFSPKSAELFAMREGLLLARRMGCENLVVESDSIQAINEVVDPSVFSPDNPVAQHILALGAGFSVVVFHHCKREANRVAHELASVCFRNDSLLVFPNAIPFGISRCVLSDFHLQ